MSNETHNNHGREEMIAAIQKWYEADPDNRAVVIVTVDKNSDAQVSSGMVGKGENIFNGLRTILDAEENTDPVAEFIEKAFITHAMDNNQCVKVEINIEGKDNKQQEPETTHNNDEQANQN